METEVTYLFIKSINFLMNEIKKITNIIPKSFVHNIQHMWMIWDSYNATPDDIRINLNIYVVIKKEYENIKSLTDFKWDNLSPIYAMTNKIAYFTETNQFVRGNYSSFKHNDCYLSHDMFLSYRSRFMMNRQLYFHGFNVDSMNPANMIDHTLLTQILSWGGPLYPLKMNKWFSIDASNDTQKIMIIMRVDNKSTDPNKFTICDTNNPEKQVSYVQSIQLSDTHFERDFIVHDAILIIGLDNPCVYTPEIGKISLVGLPEFDDIMELIALFHLDSHPSLLYIEYLMRKNINMCLGSTSTTPLTYTSESKTINFTWEDFSESFTTKYQEMAEKVKDRILQDISKLSPEQLAEILNIIADE